MATFGILVGGGPAPGINGVIGAATILARRSGACLEVRAECDVDGVTEEPDTERSGDPLGAIGLDARLWAQPVVDVMGDDAQPVPDGEGEERRRVGAAREGTAHRRSTRREGAAREQFVEQR